MRKDIQFVVQVIADTVRENEDTLTEPDAAVVGRIRNPHCMLITRSSHQDIPGIYYRYIFQSSKMKEDLHLYPHFKFFFTKTMSRINKISSQ